MQSLPSTFASASGYKRAGKPVGHLPLSYPGQWGAPIQLHSNQGVAWNGLTFHPSI
ncbi:hypothetical protein CGRA01v4_07524 [Colletotrichum graminicola]|nr:hypothetical protein CGRA01v4_07524 [Colletotrichum graminicola]